MKLQFPVPFKHTHPPLRDVYQVFEQQQTLGQKIADGVANTMGSWGFILTQSVLLAVWIILNVVGWIGKWDPYPFILMNLVLSMQAAYAAPVIMMSQNRQALKDRLEAHNDFEVNQKAELEVRAILEHLSAQDNALAVLHAMVEEIQTRFEQKPSPESPA